MPRKLTENSRLKMRIGPSPDCQNGIPRRAGDDDQRAEDPEDRSAGADRHARVGWNSRAPNEPANSEAK